MATLEELGQAFKHPTCRCCDRGRMIAAGIHFGKLKLFCNNCREVVWVEPPAIRKKLVYLDNGVIANMLKSESDGSRKTIFTDLVEVASRANALQVAIFPTSPLARQEAELRDPKMFELWLNMARGLGSSKLRNPLSIKREQFKRALERFLAKAEPTMSSKPPLLDAFYDDPHAWVDVLRFDVNWRTTADDIEASRERKDAILPAYQQVREQYRKDGFSFDQIRQAELDGIGITILAELRQYVYRTQKDDAEFYLPPLYIRLHQHLQDKHEQSVAEAQRQLQAFLNSEYVKTVPHAQIDSLLTAGLFSEANRDIGRGDDFDIQHIASYLPYVDVMVVDGYMAHLATKNPLKLHERFDTVILSSKKRGVERLIEMLGSWIAEAPHAQVARQVSEAGSEELHRQAEQIKAI